jgi:hypothetical protein
MGAQWTIREWKAHCRAVGNRFKGERKKSNGMPTDVETFLRLGGMENVEYVAAAKAADEAKRFERELYLPILERWLAKLAVTAEGDTLDDFFADLLRKDITRLRRILGVHTGSEEQRAATRERVRKHRATRREEDRQWRLRHPLPVEPTEEAPADPPIAAAFKFLLQKGQEPTVKAIMEFFPGNMTEAQVLNLWPF